MTYSITLNAQANSPSERSLVLERFSRVANELPAVVDHDLRVYTNVDAGVPSERYEELCYDETTFVRAREILRKRVTSAEADGIMNDLLKAGLLFRERPDNPARNRLVVSNDNMLTIPDIDPYLPPGIARPKNK